MYILNKMCVLYFHAIIKNQMELFDDFYQKYLITNYFGHNIQYKLNDLYFDILAALKGNLVEWYFDDIKYN